MTSIRPELIPLELRERRQWVPWKMEFRNGKRTKVPYALSGCRASSTNPASWTSFDEALDAVELRVVDGLGFVFYTADPFAGVDLDAAFNTDGELTPFALTVIGGLDSYTEISPSGAGVHVIVRAVLPPGGNRHGPLEMYDRGRFFTMTGCVLDGHSTIEERQPHLERLHSREIAAKLAPPSPSRVPRRVPLDDRELLERALSAGNGARFERLWCGDVSGYASPSEADLALCCHLAYWSAGDAARINRLFRASKLYRRKWERPDYRNRTIERAISLRRDYVPPGSRRL